MKGALCLNTCKNIKKYVILVIKVSQIESVLQRESECGGCTFGTPRPEKFSILSYFSTSIQTEGPETCHLKGYPVRKLLHTLAQTKCCL